MSGIFIPIFRKCATSHGKENAMKYRKKPVEIEAFQWTGGPDQEEDPEWIIEAIKRGYAWFGRTIHHFCPICQHRVEIPEYSESINQGLSEAAMDVAKKGSVDGFEHMYLVNLKDGKLDFYETNHDEMSVGYNFWKVVIKNPDIDYAFVHNHNWVSSLSEADLVTAATTKNIKAVIAVQNDGVIYYAKKTKNTPGDFYPDDYFSEALNPLRQALKDGTISVAERSKRREEIIIKCMLEEFFDGMVIIDGKRK